MATPIANNTGDIQELTCANRVVDIFRLYAEILESRGMATEMAASDRSWRDLIAASCNGRGMFLACDELPEDAFA
jgi:hypothetical protein